MTKAVTLIVFFAVFFCSAHAQQWYSVRGVVQDRTGAAVAGAEVRFHSAKLSTSTRTGQDGSFEIKGVSDAQGTLTLSAPGFQATSRRWVASRDNSPLAVELQPANV